MPETPPEHPFYTLHSHGLVRVAASTPKVRTADVAGNAAAIIDEARRAHNAHVDLVVYPELCVSSYAIDDLHMQGALLTDVAGRGHVFERGFVTYTNEAKSEMLGIPMDLIDEHGAVSRTIALAMAKGALERSQAHFALSITGFAGPGAPGDEEGLVHFACARRDGQTCHREEHFGSIGRGGVRIAALEVALSMVDEALD